LVKDLGLPQNDISFHFKQLGCSVSQKAKAKEDEIPEENDDEEFVTSKKDKEINTRKKILLQNYLYPLSFQRFK